MLLTIIVVAVWRYRLVESKKKKRTKERGKTTGKSFKKCTIILVCGYKHISLWLFFLASILPIDAFIYVNKCSFSRVHVRMLLMLMHCLYIHTRTTNCHKSILHAYIHFDLLIVVVVNIIIMKNVCVYSRFMLLLHGEMLRKTIRMKYYICKERNQSS
jgi:Na+/pantothenate symporter